MPTTPNWVECHESKQVGQYGSIPVDPFRALRVHFGMLLGVDDFETLDAYHRGKIRLHNAWLHREGVIWGLDVRINREHGEIRVTRGLALDRLGRELHLDAEACLNLGSWYQEHEKDPDLISVLAETEDGRIHFHAHVVIQFKSCLTRQVPALVEPCEGSGRTMAYSRIFETVDLYLRPGKAPPRGQLPYHRLRLLLGLEKPFRQDPTKPNSDITPADQEVLDRRAEILSLPMEEQPIAYLEALRHFGAQDAVELSPAKTPEEDLYSLFSGIPPAPLVLAEITNITLRKGENGWRLDGGHANAKVNINVRPFLVPTSTIQELLCGPAFTLADAGGSRIDSTTVKLQDDKTLTFHLEGEPLEASISPKAISISSFEEGKGWTSAKIKAVKYDTQKRLVTVTLVSKPAGNLVRLIVKGTGESPVLGKVGDRIVPLAGAAGGPPGGEHNGNDFVFMLQKGASRDND